MQQFKIGDRIREIRTGDIGVITSKKEDHYNIDFDGWNIAWETGECAGHNLHLPTNKIQPLESALDGSIIVISGVQYRLTKI